jgi:hypothetical protein
MISKQDTSQCYSFIKHFQVFEYNRTRFTWRIGLIVVSVLYILAWSLPKEPNIKERIDVQGAVTGKMRAADGI